ncbi:hypothetical protein [Bordetella flabilis]|uniref:Uncharacterized protein n=1 Tax=Bordetella flabilis TaxID=463014 RepID=A0A193GNA8_9BORD|nr:hypothetical protein [Bordetella flabilis]ANN80854.1 hypothetical protein BAU07_26395 [Bordetella flabilis]
MMSGQQFEELSLPEQIKAMGGNTYLDVRQLDDGTIVGLGKLLYTTAVYIDMSLWGWAHRYCFKDRDLAIAEYRKLKNGDETPTGWIAHRP